MVLVPSNVTCLGLIALIMLLGMAEATPETRVLVQCGKGTFKYCNQVERECPQGCPNHCFIDCASCEPICGSSDDDSSPSSTILTRGRVITEEGHKIVEKDKMKEMYEKEKYEKEKYEKERGVKYEKEKSENEKYEKHVKESGKKEKYEKYIKENVDKDKYEKYQKESGVKEKYEKENTDNLNYSIAYKDKYDDEMKHKYEKENEEKRKYEKEKQNKEKEEMEIKKKHEKKTRKTDWYEKEKRTKENYEKEKSKGEEYDNDDSKGSSPRPAPYPHPLTYGRKRVRCTNIKYPQCYGQMHVCPSTCASTCEVDCVTCKPVCSCDYPGAICQDPRFIGGDGITFYFHGKKDKDFCIVSDTNLHINAHFIGKRSLNMGRDFTWVQSLGILFNNHKLLIGARNTVTWDDSIDRLELILDGKPIFLNETVGFTWRSSTIPTISISRTSNTNSVIVDVHKILRITAKVVPITEEDSRVPHYGITKDDCFAHLDLAFKFYSLGGKVEGVLGKTYRNDYVSTVKMGITMPVMGGVAKYETSSLFAADCSVARFQAEGLTKN